MAAADGPEAAAAPGGDDVATAQPLTSLDLIQAEMDAFGAEPDALAHE